MTETIQQLTTFLRWSTEVEFTIPQSAFKSPRIKPQLEKAEKELIQEINKTLLISKEIIRETEEIKIKIKVIQ